jgi:hypothetical protein
MKQLYTIICIFLFISCSSNIHFQQKLKHKEAKLAVLHFSGKGVSRTLRYLAADELTTLLYVDKKYLVIDRSLVNAVVQEFEIENPYFLSKEKLITVSDSLSANVMVLGLIENEKDAGFLEKGENHFTITLRFLDGKSSDVIGMIYEKESSFEPPFKVIPGMLIRMVNGRNFQTYTCKICTETLYPSLRI